MSAEQAVLMANAAFYQAFQERDMDAMAMIWSQGSGTLCVHPGRNAIKGWDAIRSSWSAIFRNTNLLEIDTEIISVETNGTLAYVVLVESVLQVTGGRRSKALSVATNIYECMTQKWYLIHHHGSPLMMG